MSRIILETTTELLNSESKVTHDPFIEDEYFY